MFRVISGVSSGDLDDLNSRFVEKTVAPACAIGKDDTLFGAGERDEESGCRLDLIASKAPPCTIVEANER